MVATYILLRDMYATMFEEGASHAPELAQAFQSLGLSSNKITLY